MRGSMITRLEKLKAEKKLIQSLKCLRFDYMEKCIEHYDFEIKCIEEYNSPNPSYEDDE